MTERKVTISEELYQKLFKVAIESRELINKFTSQEKFGALYEFTHLEVSLKQLDELTRKLIPTQ